MISDSPGFQNLLRKLYPELDILGVAKASGQRIVYFCRFGTPPVGTTRPDWSNWGDVVLKVSSGMDPQAIAYMQMEIAILNGLDSPYFPKLHFHEIYSEIPETEEKLPIRIFVTIEDRIPSEPLSACRAQFSNERDVLRLLIRLTEALTFLWAHERKLVHRDLKPDNILVRPDGNVCVIDLGILRETGAAGITATNASHGPLTPGYSSPEQAQNDKKNISFKSDLFSLGTIGYELLSGKNPYIDQPTDTKGQILANVISRAPPRLDDLGKCSKELADILARLMEKEPYKRYRTPEHLKADLVQVEQRQIR